MKRDQEQVRILSVTSVRNEGPYLLEWIAHHKAAGVTDFLVFSNDCEDGTEEMLTALDAAGIVTHVPHERVRGKSIQWQALNAAWKHPLRKAADWVLVSDVDEFLNIHTGDRTLGALLKAVPDDADGVVIPWRLFGSNDVLGVEDQPVTQQFTRAIPADAQYPVAASFFKTLFRAKGPFNQLGVHRPKQKTAEKAGLPVFVDGSGKVLPEGMVANQNRLSLFGISSGRKLVEMNHYSVRSAAAFLIKKARGLPNRASKPVDLTYWVERNFNTVEDRSIDAMRAATEAELTRLWAVPGLERLHKQAVAWHQARFSELVLDLENHSLLVQILTAGGSQVVPEYLQQQLVRWYQVAHKNNT